jgi:hypothetical protein
MRAFVVMLLVIVAAPLSAQPSFRGVYVGTVRVGGQATNSVVLVNVIKNDQAIGLVYDYIGRTFLEVPGVPIAADGRFSFTAAGLVVAGRMLADGFTATGEPGNQTIIGLKAPTAGVSQAFAGSFPGWLVTPTAIRDHGLLITADGWIFTYARTGPTTSDGAVGRISAAGEFTLSFVGGATAAGSVRLIAQSPTITGAYQRSGVWYDMIGGRESAVNDLINISTRGLVGTGASAMIAGFVIQPAAKTVYVRALGPTLTIFGVPDVLADPVIELYSGATLIASNDDWQTGPSGALIANRHDKPGDAKEPGLLLTLEPGAYTVILRGKGTATGNALIEVNQID